LIFAQTNLLQWLCGASKSHQARKYELVIDAGGQASMLMLISSCPNVPVMPFVDGASKCVVQILIVFSVAGIVADRRVLIVLEFSHSNSYRQKKFPWQSQDCAVALIFLSG
jgi:hypothetical protein